MSERSGYEKMTEFDIQQAEYECNKLYEYMMNGTACCCEVCHANWLFLAEQYKFIGKQKKKRGL